MIELVIGGARSGKSNYAMQTALKNDGCHYFVATAERSDDEMMERICRHRMDRGREWRLIEEPRALAGLVSDFSEGDTVVVDCLTLWLNNWLCGDNPDGWKAEKDAFISAVRDSGANWILVSNEIGMGVVPMGRLSRDFVDNSGWLHQDLAEAADTVTLVQFGMANKLK